MDSAGLMLILHCRHATAHIRRLIHLSTSPNAGGGGLAVTETPSPSDNIARQLLDNLRQTSPLTHPPLEPASGKLPYGLFDLTQSGT